MRHGRRLFVFTFLVPPLALYAVFVISPYLQAFQISLTNWRGLSPTYEYVGPENFGRLLQDHYVWNALKNNAIILVALPILTIVLALFFASMLSVGGRKGKAGVSGVRGAAFYRVVYFFPQVLSVAIIGVLWKEVYAPRSGILNGFLRTVGLDGLAKPWLGDPDLVFWCVLAVMVWAASASTSCCSRRHAVDPQGDLRGGDARRCRARGDASGSPCRCCGTPSRWRGYIWRSSRSTASPSCRS